MRSSIGLAGCSTILGKTRPNRCPREHAHKQDPVLHAEIPGTWVEVTYAVNEVTMNVRLLEMGPIPEEQQTDQP